MVWQFVNWLRSCRTMKHNLRRFKVDFRACVLGGGSIEPRTILFDLSCHSSCESIFSARMNGNTYLYCSMWCNYSCYYIFLCVYLKLSLFLFVVVVVISKNPVFLSKKRGLLCVGSRQAEKSHRDITAMKYKTFNCRWVSCDVIHFNCFGTLHVLLTYH